MRRFALALAAVLALAAPSLASAWTWPVDGAVIRPFVFGSNPYAAAQHRGIDVAAPSGGSVAAPAGGVVSFVGTLPTHGLAVTIRTADGWSVTLLHLGSAAVTAGSSVAEGATVGTIGPSGVPEVDVPYVHLGIRATADEQGYVDPLAFLPQRTTPEPPAPPPTLTGAEAPARPETGAGTETPAATAQIGRAHV